MSAIIRPASEAVLRHDPRLIVLDADRLVLRTGYPWVGAPRRDVRYIYAGVALLAGVVLALCCWLLPFISPVGAGVLWLLLVVAGATFVFEEGVLVALRADDALFIEWRDVLTRRKRRLGLGRLSSITGYQIRRHLDTESGVLPEVYFELRLVDDRTKPGSRPVWYSGSEEAAVAVGETMLRLRPQA